MSENVVTNFAEHAKMLRQQFRNDHHRPQYHFLAPANWMNDPNGVIHYKGQYHLFYQHNPDAPVWGNIHWGHAVSDDLVHWHDLPIALAPTPDGADTNGCWSGCALIDKGVPTIIYTGIDADNQQLPCLATSDDRLITWTKYAGNPIIPTTPDDLKVLGFRDHSVWKEEDGWYQIIGSGSKDVGGMVFLYRSQDLRHWEYLHPLLTGDKDNHDPLWTGTMWECPQFFKLGDKHVLIFSVHDGARGYYTVYFTGTYQDHRFFPETLQKLDYGDMHFYAPQMCFDAQGRALIWGWITEDRSIEAQVAAGWAGVMSLPRILEMGRDGRLLMRPVPETESLRRYYRRFVASDLIGLDGRLPDVFGSALEIHVEFDVTDSSTCGIKLLESTNGEEYLFIFYNSKRKCVGTQIAGLQPTTQEGELFLTPEEHLKLHIFVDHSVIEVYANERACLTSRFYPTRFNNLELKVVSEFGPALIAAEVWELESIWTR